MWNIQVFRVSDWDLNGLQNNAVNEQITSEPLFRKISNFASNYRRPIKSLMQRLNGNINLQKFVEFIIAFSCEHIIEFMKSTRNLSISYSSWISRQSLIFKVLYPSSENIFDIEISRVRYFFDMEIVRIKKT